MSCGLFQSTHPSGVRQRGHGFLLKGSLFQSTHPSGVRHLQLSHLTYRFEISIHAPQWGATNTRLSALPCLGHFNPRTPVGCDRSSDTPYPRTRYYFNPRTPVGCDRNGWCPRSPQPHFNPRTPVGCDPASGSPSAWRTISIHAPQWGATSRLSRRPKASGFQSTHPSGVRLPGLRLRRGAWNFNPRTPVGCDNLLN